MRIFSGSPGSFFHDFINFQNNEEFEVLAHDYEETIKELKEQLDNLRRSPRRQNSKGKKSSTEGDVKEHSRHTPENLKLAVEPTSEFEKPLVERPGAEVGYL